MESLIAEDTGWNTGKGSSNPRLRMATRPPSQPSMSQQRKHDYGIGSRLTSMGAASEDLNSGFGRSHQTNTKSMPRSSQTKSKPTKDSFGDDDEDELNLLSQSSQHESDEASKVSRVTKVPGPDTKLHTQVAIKGLSFRKKRTNSSNDLTGSQSSQGSQLKANAKKENQRSRSNSQDQTTPLKKHRSMVNLATPRARSPTRKEPAVKEVLNLSDDEPPHPPKAKVKPRPLHARQTPSNQGRLSPEISFATSPGSKQVSATSPRTIKKPNYGRRETVPSAGSDKSTRHSKSRLAPFPMITSPESRASKSSTNTRPVATENPKPSKADQRTKKALTMKGRGKTVVLSSEDDDESNKGRAAAAGKKQQKRKQAKKPEVQPFPMSTQYIEGIGRPASPSGSSRMSFSDSDHDQDSGLNTDADQFSWEGDEDTITMSSVDHKKLCPYCDGPMPQQPSAYLQTLLDAAAKTSKPDPRPWNRFGRKAPFSSFIAVCQRHKFETEVLPEAEAQGWPKSIDWSQLGNRVKGMALALQLLIDNPIVEDPWSYSPEPRPRDKCVFWDEIISEVKAKGAKVVAGFQGQFANFEKVQLGYYGELGSVIINQILYDMFPLKTINPESVAPLTPIEFVQKVLVPEVGARLIREDRQLEDSEDGLKQAVVVLRESSSYGITMFPADEKEESEEKVRSGDTGVADRIVMARAEKRRKELEEEEADEADDEEPPPPPPMQTTRKAKERSTRPTKSKGKEKEAFDIPSSPPRQSRPKPRPVAKAHTATNSLAGEDQGHSSDVYWQGFSDADDPPSSDRKRPRAADEESDVMNDLDTGNSTPDSVKRRKLDRMQDFAKQDDKTSMASSPSRSSIPRPRPVKKSDNTERSRSTTSRASSVKRSDTEDTESEAGEWMHRQRPPPQAKPKLSSKKRIQADIDLCSSSEDESSRSKTARKAGTKALAHMSEDEQDEVSTMLVEITKTPKPLRQDNNRRLNIVSRKDETSQIAGDAPSSQPSKAPLQRARDRAQRVVSESSSKDITKTNFNDTKNTYKWLLSSQSSMSEIEG